jgi:hypothetical protein
MQNPNRAADTADEPSAPAALPESVQDTWPADPPFAVLDQEVREITQLIDRLHAERPKDAEERGSLRQFLAAIYDRAVLAYRGRDEARWADCYEQLLRMRGELGELLAGRVLIAPEPVELLPLCWHDLSDLRLAAEAAGLTDELKGRLDAAAEALSRIDPEGVDALQALRDWRCGRYDPVARLLSPLA